MRVTDAVAMIGAGFDSGAAEVWADLGCGRGTFTLALAQLLAESSTIHAMDTDAAALRALPPNHDGVAIRRWHVDFLATAWPVADLDGVLMANSLHFAPDQRAVVRTCASHMRGAHRFLIVEYDFERAIPWVPHPVGRRALRTLFEDSGYGSITMLGSRRSTYHRADLYAALVEGPPSR